MLEKVSKKLGITELGLIVIADLVAFVAMYATAVRITKMLTQIIVLRIILSVPLYFGIVFVVSVIFFLLYTLYYKIKEAL